MSAFHLRPVADLSPSPSPTASTTAPDDHSPSYKPPSSIRPSPPLSSGSRIRRPLSPSSLRDVDLTHSTDAHSRKYPAPPTGHDLMAMFPPPPPDNFPEMRPGTTSGYFQRQERAFFAQAGKEIVRVRVEVDLPHGAAESSELGKSSSSSLSRANSNSSRPWPPAAGSSSSSHAGSGGSGSASQSPNMPSSAAPVLYPHPPSRPSPRGPIAVNPAPLFPLSTNHPHPHSAPPPNLHGAVPLHQNGPATRTPPQDSSQASVNAKSEYSQDDYDDESWRRPMPYAERRRAGKHTRRVIVRT